MRTPTRPATRLAAVRRALVAEHARRPDDVLARPARPVVGSRPAPTLAAVRSALAGRPGRPRGAR